MDDLLDESWKGLSLIIEFLSQCASKELTLVTEFEQRALGQRSTDLQSFGHDRWGDELVRWNFLVQLLIGSFVEENLVVQLVADLSLRPLLLLGLAAATSSLLLLLCLLWLLSRRFRVLLWRLQREK